MDGVTVIRRILRSPAGFGVGAFIPATGSWSECSGVVACVLVERAEEKTEPEWPSLMLEPAVDVDERGGVSSMSAGTFAFPLPLVLPVVLVLALVRLSSTPPSREGAGDDGAVYHTSSPESSSDAVGLSGTASADRTMTSDDAREELDESYSGAAACFCSARRKASAAIRSSAHDVTATTEEGQLKDNEWGGN
jgi:hypothetical protein